MDEGKLFGRGISFPPRIGPDGRMTMSAGPENIRESIRVILLTEPQERLMRAEFGAGLQRFLFEPNTVTTHRLIQEHIRQALQHWEPRIRVQSITVVEDPSDRQAATATIQYRLVTSGTTAQVSLTVQLAG
jgi:uncharacterized protein